MDLGTRNVSDAAAFPQPRHHFASGATLIAGEALLPLPRAGDPPLEAASMRTVPFQQPFGRCPALLTTLAASTQQVRPRCIGGAAAPARSQPRARTGARARPRARTGA